MYSTCFHPFAPKKLRRTTLVDENYVLRHARFGKSRRRKDRGGPRTLRYGSRASSKLVRCYEKEGIGRYRVELELHAPLLRKWSIRNIADLPLVATKLWSAHFSFKVVRWDALEAHLAQRYGPEKGKKLYEKAREYAQTSLLRVNRFLSGVVHNPHRFWGSAVTNRDSGGAPTVGYVVRT